MSPRIVDKEAKKRQIAYSAVKTFSSRGFETTSMNEIAQNAGVGKGTLYEYFESKEDLVVYAIINSAEIMLEQTKEQYETIEDPCEKLTAYINGTMEAFLADRDVIKFMISSFQFLIYNEKWKGSLSVMSELMDSLRSEYTKVILEGISKGVFKPEIAYDAEKISINLFAYMDGIALHYLMSPEKIDLKKQISMYTSELLDRIKK